MNMRVYCRCGNMLTNQLDPNDTEYYVYSDREWCEIQKNEYIHVLDIPLSLIHISEPTRPY